MLTLTKKTCPFFAKLIQATENYRNVPTSLTLKQPAGIYLLVNQVTAKLVFLSEMSFREI